MVLLVSGVIVGIVSTLGLAFAFISWLPADPLIGPRVDVGTRYAARDQPHVTSRVA